MKKNVSSKDWHKNDWETRLFLACADFNLQELKEYYSTHSEGCQWWHSHDQTLSRVIAYFSLAKNHDRIEMGLKCAKWLCSQGASIEELSREAKEKSVDAYLEMMIDNMDRKSKDILKKKIMDNCR